MSLKKISYPILPSDRELSNKNVVQKELTNEELNERYYGHNNSFGFYPIGRLSSWHGGIHIEGSNCVRAIADGRIIAYRFAEDYLLEKDTQRKYSNSFILVQHNYESPGKQKNKDEEPTTQKLRFYSLYMHLSPKVELEKNNNKSVPDLYAKYIIKTNTNTLARGLKVRMYCKDDTTKSDEHAFIPLGGILKKDSTTKAPDKHWMNNIKLNPIRKQFGKKYIFCSYNGEVVIALGAWLTKKGGDQYIVKHIKASDKNTYDKKAKTGTMVFDAINGKHIKMLNIGTELEIEKTENKDWLKVKNKKQYLLNKDCSKIFKKLKNDIVLNSVKNVDTSIKAGDIIGVPAQYSFEKQNAYNCVHLEVFTDDTEVDNFLKNHVGDDNQTTIEIPKGKTLQIAKPCNFLKKDTKVKILEIKDHYTQIGFEDIEGIVTFDNRIKWNSTGKYYQISSFEKVNSDFNNLLDSSVKKLYFSDYMKKDANGEFSKTTKKAESIARSKDAKHIKYRKLKYNHPKENKKYWVDNTEVVGDKNTWVTLTQDIKSYYEEEPKKTNTDIITTEKITARKISTTKDNKDIDWYNVQGKGKQKTNKGWIKKSDLTFINPYNWLDESYGWEVFEDPDNNYFYHFGESFTNNTPKKFVNKVWEKLKKYDDDQNNLLTENELNNAMQKDTAVKDLSRLICKHFNEWDIKNKISDFNTEIDKVYEKGVNLATGDKKIKLEEARDAKKVLLEEKINNLCFWDQITDGDVAEADQHYNGKVKPEEKRTFPVDSSSIYHFHPIAFVEHMKLITAPTQAPWVEYILQEFETYKGIKEKESPLKEKISEYHNAGTAKGHNYKIAWCASFVSWCFDQTKSYKKINSGANSYAFDWGPHGNLKAAAKSKAADGWKEGEETEAFVGAVIVLSYSHCAFIVGKNSMTNRYVYIGGNQGSRVAGEQQIKYGTVKIGQEFAIMKPKKYKVQSFTLPEMNKNADGSYKSSR